MKYERQKMSLKLLPFLTAGMALLGGFSVEAKPLTYPGGWQTTAEASGDAFMLLNSYTITPTFGLGLQNEYDREADYQMHSLSITHRLWRGNSPDSQGNLFLLSGAGYARADGGTAESPAAYTGILADWEDRRIYTEYQNRYVHAGDVNREYTQKARIGVAPYIAESGALHTWLILQVDHKPKADDPIKVTPLVRLFQGSTMIEAGINEDAEPLFHFMYQF